ncbi:MAG: BlaI/MecI/CopY family transcriptional regulator, partial [Clostridia bacterium]|nr:BlaI/MecI/CopY family transcriptional regulator [Clostridia bacterium]
YTVLRKLCERGLFENVNGVVNTRIPMESFYAAKSEQLVDSAFNGSLPAFLTAFTSRKGLSEEEADEIVRMIEAYRKENRK